jgi:hypothetical protein
MTELAMTAKCRTCGRTFAGPQLAIVGKGVDPANNRLMQFMEKLSSHVELHREPMDEINLGVLEYRGWRILSEYETENKDLLMQFDLYRWGLHQKTLGGRYSDAQIEQWVGQVIPQLLTLADMRDIPTLTKNLCGMLASMRDKLEEPGKYVFNPMEPSLSGVKQ